MRDKIKVAACTLGCKVNMYDTESMLELFRNSGYEITDFDSRADIYIINTCTVTNLSDKKSRQMIRRAKRFNPDSLIVAAGCYAQAEPEAVARIDGVNLILGTKDRLKIVHLVEELIECERDGSACFINSVSDIRSETLFEKSHVTNMAGRQRAFVKIQDGCDRFCTFCIIPYVRGRSRSRLPDDILIEVRNLSEKGYKEIVLSGIHAASYGKDLDKNFAQRIRLTDIIEMVHNIDGIERIRLSSIDPSSIDTKFVDTIKPLTKLCDHFHLSLQSGCNDTLKRMNRHYTTEQYAEAVALLRAAFPDTAITTDVIVGFPGETDEGFSESLRFVEEMRFARIHVFPYSKKAGTFAARLPGQTNDAIKTARNAEMLKLGEKLSSDFLMNFVNKNLSVLFERQLDRNRFEGYSTNYIPIVTESETNLINKILTVKIASVEKGMAKANV